MHCGIDFGTSNTTLAVVQDGTPQLALLEGAAPNIPTALFFPIDNQPVLFGRQAVEAYLDGREGRLLRSLKRILGTALMRQTTQIGHNRVGFDAIIGRFLAHIKYTAEASLQTDLSDVTLGRPVHFQDGDAQADRDAEAQLQTIAQQAGFKNIRFQFEPVAAALAHEKNVVGEQLALVIDIGGGTSDYSIIRLSRDYDVTRDRAQDIIANHGVRVGGNDCDKAVNLDAMMPLLGLGSRIGEKNLEMPVLLYHELSEWAKINFCYTPQNIQQLQRLLRDAQEPEKIECLLEVLNHQLGHHILNNAELLKIALSTEAKASSDLSFLASGLHVSMTQKHMHLLLRQTLQPVHDAMLEILRQAQLKTTDMAVIVLTGGSTGLPVFQNWLAQNFPQATILQDNRLGSVGLGLALTCWTDSEAFY